MHFSYFSSGLFIPVFSLIHYDFLLEIPMISGASLPPSLFLYHIDLLVLHLRAFPVFTIQAL